MTQIENPRTQWRQEQERMLKEYLVVAQEALEAKKEIAFRIVVQREIRPGADEGGGGLQEGEATPPQEEETPEEPDRKIDRKMSCSQTNYKLDEAQAIFSELRSIKKFISTGEKERQDLIQCLAKLTVNFQNSGEVGNAGNAGGSELQFCDTGCQTDLIGEYGSQDSSHLVDKVKVNWQYEEAKKCVCVLDSDSWSGRVEADRDRDFLQLLREKEALLQELEEVIRQQICPETLLQLEEERGRLEGEVQRANSSQSQGANQRILQQEKRNALLRQLEEATRITTYLHSQLKSMSASSLTVSSSSSRGSLASSRGSLASSRGSLSSISFSDIYGFPQYEGGAGEEPHLRYLLQADPPPISLASLSSRSSLSSLSPPGSPMDTPYLPPPTAP
ncbi:hypothetical protein F7725_027193 [Dissostichus mawsoni]|uniref:WWC1-like helical hairpin domain-containing protein n=1 Tax=Dissostichus mawsoni TaxID=36200 RepID=A0A7J5XC89_DISMA|nr:hypothetical protein F7725_027193 [Dissostichus mawsoni]